MSVTINGSGTITGISVGGLPDGSITNDDLAGSIDDAKLSGTTCKAFVNFDGTGTVAIRAQFNVSSITDNGTGDYTVNFTTALVDANYAALQGGESGALAIVAANRTTSSLKVFTTSRASGSQGINADQSAVDVAIFR
jgi:hypothetical protein